MSGYQPGHCNISEGQRRWRYVGAAAAFVATGVYVAAYVAGLLSTVSLFAVFIPLAIGFELGIEAYNSFCVRLALLNRYDFRLAGDGRETRVTDPDDRREDHVQAVTITVTGIVLAGVVTLALYLLLA